MKTIAILLVIVWAQAIMTPGQQNSVDSSAAAKFRQLETARFEAQRRGDNVALDAMFDNALVWIDPDGVQLTKFEYLAKLRLARAKVLEIEPESMTVHAFGNTVVVLGIYHEKGVKDGRRYVQRARFINTWAFRNGKWMCIAAAATSSLK
jgi:ketosteroid isomerase-like protein